VDNGTDATEALIPPDPSIRYTKVTGTLSTGEMRNLCVKQAQGKFICHFDSDDWSAPERVADQITRLGVFGVVTGYDSMLFYDERDGQCYQWSYPAPIRFALGTSLCYRKAWWDHHPFHALRVGEDVRFFMQAIREANRLVLTAPANHLMVARVHNQQTSRKTLNRTSYKPVPPVHLPPLYPCDLTSSPI